MPTNLVSSIMQMLTPDLVGRIASGLGLDPNQAEQAISAAVPSILAGLTGVASKPEGAQRLANVLNQHSASSLDEMKNSIGQSGQAFADHGASTLSTLLGSGGMKSLSNAIGSFAGIQQGAGKSLLGMLAPVVLGALSQHQKSAGLDANGVANMLAGQKNAIANAMPSGLAQHLSGTGILDSVSDSLHQGAAAASTAVSRIGNAAGSAASNSAYAASSGAGRSALPLWLLAIAAIGGVLWYLLGTGHEPGEIARQTATQIDAQAAKQAPGSVVGPMAAVPPASVAELSRQVTSSLNGVATTLRGITDASSAQAAMPKLQDAVTNLEQLGSLTDRLPPDARQSVGRIVSAAMPTLNQLSEQILANPELAAAKPAIEALRTKLQSLSGT